MFFGVVIRFDVVDSQHAEQLLTDDERHTQPGVDVTVRPLAECAVLRWRIREDVRPPLKDDSSVRIVARDGEAHPFDRLQVGPTHTPYDFKVAVPEDLY